MRPDDTRAEAAATRLPLAEEVLRVGRRDTVTDGIRVTTRVASEEHIVGAELAEDHVEITRVAIGRVVDEPPATRSEGDVTIIPILVEEAVVVTRLVLKEEIHLRRRTETRRVEVPVTLRRQHAEIERGLDPTGRDHDPSRDHDQQRED